MHVHLVCWHILAFDTFVMMLYLTKLCSSRTFALLS